MRVASKYEFKQDGNWSLLLLPERWNSVLWSRILEVLRNQAPTPHPQTERLPPLEGHEGEGFYLKVYYSLNAVENFKDLVRGSKAFRALKQAEALDREGFRVPLVVAAGQEKTHRFLNRSFLLSEEIEGRPLNLFLRERFAFPLDVTALRQKREYLRRLATEVSRLHRSGFVHGDLTAYNVLVRPEMNGMSFFFLDNDRTRRYPPWFPQGLWKRNLVQLNRFKLAGISLQDRIRFLRFYLGNGAWKTGDRRLLTWLEKRTRRRRAWKDRFRGDVSFRELMRWDGRPSKKSRVR
jgi:serine/threonine protein kinase